jgi:molybdate transport system regulatory protein
VNKLDGTIINVEFNNHMSLVDVTVGNLTLTATLLETPATAAYLQAKVNVQLLFKETEVSLAKNLSGELSLRNKIACKITAIQLGDIMSAISLDFEGKSITSVITTRAVKRLQLEVGDQVEALIKANEIALMELKQ